MTNKVTVGEKIKIRQAEIKDVERITSLCQQLEYSVTNEQIEERLTKITNDDAYIVYVATLEDEYVIGWAHAHICDSIVIPTPAILLGLIVDKDYRHNGIGSVLMQQIEQWAFLIGCEGILLRSNVKRREAHSFYEKIGYRNIKQSVTFYKKLQPQE